MDQAEYEKNLIKELRDEWEPARGLAMQSRKTEPLSEVTKEVIAGLGASVGMTVTFTVEPITVKDGPDIQQHYVNAVRPRKTPAT